ncbi:MAG: ABC-2 family transporter protein [Planctomycetaceae bacterium]|nr:ABC-2 family transporter protein [Planctomycetaceae bacterium]MCB9950547.1 ABC-2 family transporter protein [Planctomycetaceae bacterium]
MEQFRPNYLRVWLTFLRNSLVRELSFRGNFFIEVVTRTFWFSAQLALFGIIYRQVNSIQDWSQYEYFAFMATGMLINALVEALFMPNCAAFSELIRTGNLDFVLLKPIDTQFLVSFQTVNLSMISQIALAVSLLVYSLSHLDVTVTAGNVLAYCLLIAVGTSFFYSLMIALASTSVWLGRNQGLYDFWFYITIFARYPQGVYRQSAGGEIVWFVFSFIVPILLVVTVPARLLLTKALEPNSGVLVVAPLMTLILLFVSRRVFMWSLNHYRSASS